LLVRARLAHEMEGIEPHAVRQIGVVRSALTSPEEAPNQAFEGAPAAVLEIDARYTDALHRIHAGDELILLT
jgi:tRNA (Thr-GGU) A37 N-methylase